MRICIACARRFESSGWRCPSCGAEPPRLDGFHAFAPELARGGTGFHESYFDKLAELEEQNFWFQARTALILDALRRHAPSARSLIDVGCGGGVVLQTIRARTLLEVRGAEPFVRGLAWARMRVPDAELIQSDILSLPYEEEFDVAGAFDVLEHIANDAEALIAIRRILKPGGVLILTAPQHPWLWSGSDEIARHERRYTRSDLVEKLASARFRVVSATSFVSLLLPLLMATRRLRGRQARAELHLPQSVNRILRVIMAAERGLIASGVRFPVGGSLLVVAVKDEPAAAEDQQRDIRSGGKSRPDQIQDDRDGQRRQAEEPVTREGGDSDREDQDDRQVEVEGVDREELDAPEEAKK